MLISNSILKLHFFLLCADYSHGSGHSLVQSSSSIYDLAAIVFSNKVSTFIPYQPLIPMESFGFSLALTARVPLT